MTGQGVDVDSRPSSGRRRGLFSSSSSQIGEENEYGATCQRMVDELTADELEHAARSSYKYLMKSLNAKNERTKELNEERDYCAKKMAMRHLASKKGKFDVSMEKFRKCIKFRKDLDLDGLRLCFQADKLDLDDETRELYATYRERLEARMQSGRVYVRGYDRVGSAVYTMFPGRSSDFDFDWFIKESLYNFERAIAASERESGEVEERVTIIGNYVGFTSKNSAPMSLNQEFMSIMRHNYPGRVKKVFLINTSTSLNLLWSLIKNFIGTETRKKINFLSERQRESSFREILTQDQAAPWMLKGGQKSEKFNQLRYLRDIPFDEAFD